VKESPPFSISDRLPGGLGGGLVEVLHVADEGGSELLLRVVRNVYPIQAKTTLQKNFNTKEITPQGSKP
jgi:hypothetical protein